ncbi:hypothetical protein DsansV1_C01g0009731 [Dioscorea sansibarensis]
MGKVCCTEADDESAQLFGFLMAVVIALVLMLICIQPRRHLVVRPVPRCYY